MKLNKIIPDTQQFSISRVISRTLSSINSKVLVSLFFSTTMILAACHDTTETNVDIKNNKTTKNISTLTRADKQKTINLGYVDQSKIISNGDDYGVKVLAVRRTAGGYILDFRFKLKDVKKAEYIMQRKIKAYLTVEKSNAKLSVPVTYKMGALRQSGKNLKENKNYFMFFANPGGHVKVGDLVTIEIADFKAEHITVN